MSKILINTNTVLDVLLDRLHHAEPGASAWAAVETGLVEGIRAAHAVGTIHYLVQKELGGLKAKRIVSWILRVFGVAAVDGAVIQGRCNPRAGSGGVFFRTPTSPACRATDARLVACLSRCNRTRYIALTFLE